MVAKWKGVGDRIKNSGGTKNNNNNKSIQKFKYQIQFLFLLATTYFADIFRKLLNNY